jgi:hypothetical protein
MLILKLAEGRVGRPSPASLCTITRCNKELSTSFLILPEYESVRKLNLRGLKHIFVHDASCNGIPDTNNEMVIVC